MMNQLRSYKLENGWLVEAISPEGETWRAKEKAPGRTRGLGNTVLKLVRHFFGAARWFFDWTDFAARDISLKVGELLPEVRQERAPEEHVELGPELAGNGEHDKPEETARVLVEEIGRMLPGGVLTVEDQPLDRGVSSDVDEQAEQGATLGRVGEGVTLSEELVGQREEVQA